MKKAAAPCLSDDSGDGAADARSPPGAHSPFGSAGAVQGGSSRQRAVAARPLGSSQTVAAQPYSLRFRRISRSETTASRNPLRGSAPTNDPARDPARSMPNGVPSRAVFPPWWQGVTRKVFVGPGQRRKRWVGARLGDSKDQVCCGGLRACFFSFSQHLDASGQPFLPVNLNNSPALEAAKATQWNPRNAARREAHNGCECSEAGSDEPASGDPVQFSLPCQYSRARLTHNWCPRQ